LRSNTFCPPDGSCDVASVQFRRFAEPFFPDVISTEPVSVRLPYSMPEYATLGPNHRDLAKILISRSPIPNQRIPPAAPRDAISITYLPPDPILTRGPKQVPGGRCSMPTATWLSAAMAPSSMWRRGRMAIAIPAQQAIARSFVNQGCAQPPGFRSGKHRFTKSRRFRRIIGL
jgi:hypothetical protein